MRIPLTIRYFSGEPDDLPGWAGRAALVCDVRTHAALGHRLEKAAAKTLVLPGVPHADDATVALLRRETAGCAGLLAVGSGTIGDLCKYASFLDGTSYAMFPTAPSMNGYTSANASITLAGHKQTVAAHLPEAVYLDLGVLASAPPRLIRAGLGDVLCRATAQADWLLSHLLLDTPYDPAPFAWLAPLEPVLLESGEALMRGDCDAMKALIDALLLSGYGMTHCGGSYPASQGEHLIAHAFEMKHPALAARSHHGEQIAVTTLTMARIQREMLLSCHPRNAKRYRGSLPLPPSLEIPAQGGDDGSDESEILAHFGAAGESVLAAFRRKAAWYSMLPQRLAERWEFARAAVAAVILPPETLERALTAAGAPTRPADLGWPEEDYAQAIRFAPAIRERFTFLDLASYSETK